MIILTVISMSFLPVIFTQALDVRLKYQEFEQEILPLNNVLEKSRLAREAVLEKAGKLGVRLANLDLDYARGVIEIEEYVSERRKLNHERKRLEAEITSIMKRRTRAEAKFWESEHHFKDEFSSNYNIETLDKSLIIYCNPTLNLLSGRDVGFKLTGYEVWDCGQTLAKYLEVTCANNSWIRGKTVLELASGTALVGIVAACLGANVTATDQPAMIPFTQKNIDANAAQLKGTSGEIRAQNLFWGNKEHMKLIPRPDIILVSGAVYEREAVEPLVSTLVALSDEGTELVICNDDMSDSIEDSLTWDVFMDHVNKHFQLSLVPLKGLVDPIDTGAGTGKVLLLRGYFGNAENKLLLN